MIKPALAFFAVLLVAAILLWLGGFNFDQRNFDVALYAAFSLFLAIMSACFVGGEKP